MSVALVLGLLAVSGAGCKRGDNRKAEEMGEKAKEAEASVTAENVGQPIVLSGRVTRKLGERGLLVSGEREFLVIRDKDLASDATIDDYVRVRGTVRKLSAEDLERDLGTSLEPELKTLYENKPVVMATEIDKTAPQGAG